MSLTTLRRGAASAEVRNLQDALLAAGFDPGRPDGQFGAGTEAAVLAFQASEGLLADGVAGPRTLRALGLGGSGELADALASVTTQLACGMFPFTPVGNIKKNLPFVLDALRQRRLVDKPMVLMALATIRAEAEVFLPVSEGQSKYNTSPNGHAFDLYDSRKDLGNRGAPDGARYKGRGFIQLTGRHNYASYGPRLNRPVNLEAEPELAGASGIAAELLALFLGDRERQIKEALVRQDMRTARWQVNGGYHGLDRFTDAYTRGDVLMGSLA
ncbi:peptidoglycan-binding protein [Polaromonas sp.]|uniref:peptidoglycan-binding protein n=1 Tax=Polaromonas sp. TaxID=1869339 RepID=UPI003C875436